MSTTELCQEIAKLTDQMKATAESLRSSREEIEREAMLSTQEDAIWEERRLTAEDVDALAERFEARVPSTFMRRMHALSHAESEASFHPNDKHN